MIETSRQHATIRCFLDVFGNSGLWASEKRLVRGFRIALGVMRYRSFSLANCGYAITVAVMELHSQERYVWTSMEAGFPISGFQTSSCRNISVEQKSKDAQLATTNSVHCTIQVELKNIIIRVTAYVSCCCTT